MTFEEMLDQALAMLQRRGRVTYRALKLQFRLDDDHLEALKDELLYAHPHVVEDDGRGLIWTGETRPTPTPGAPPAPDQERVLLSYTPAHLTEKILEARPSLEGERKQVTVLFADLKGSMELLADRDPEEARQLLDPVLQRMMEAVHRYEGTVNQVMGDGIMALFGAPLAHEDHAVRACYAALAMQDALRRYSEEVRRTHGVEAQIRVGLNSGEVVLHARASERLGFASQAQGDYRRAIDGLGQTVASLEGAGRHERFGQVQLPAVVSRVFLTWCHAELGTFAEGNALGDEGLRIAEAVDHPASLMMASWGIGLLALRHGDLPRALPPLERAMGICQAVDFQLYFPLNAVTLGVAYTLSGRVADGVPLLTQAMDQTTAPDMIGFQAFRSLSLGEAQLLASRLEEAHALAERALALAHAHQERGDQAYALRLLGEIAAHREPPESDQAEAHYRQALALAEELGMRPLQAHCHRSLGKLYATIGRRAEARAKLDTAIKLYRAMEMTLWLPEAEAALAQVEGR